MELITHIEESLDPDGCDRELERSIKSVLSDRPRPGKEPVFIPEQILIINELACKNPKDFGWELSHWNLPALTAEVARQGIVESISPASVWRFLNLAGIAP